MPAFERDRRIKWHLSVNGDPFSCAPRRRIDHPIPGVFQVGDFVTALIGNQKEKNGIVVADKNGNYKDDEDRFGKDAIGVSFYVSRKRTDDARFESLVSEVNAMFGGNHESLAASWQVRWFPSPETLSLVSRINDKLNQ